MNVPPCEGGRTIVQYEAAEQLEGGIYSDLLVLRSLTRTQYIYLTHAVGTVLHAPIGRMVI